MSTDLGFRILIVSEIADSLSCIPYSKAQDSGFHKLKFPYSGFSKLTFPRFWNPYYLTQGDKVIFTGFSDASGISGSVYSFLSLYALFVSSRNATSPCVTRQRTRLRGRRPWKGLEWTYPQWRHRLFSQVNVRKKSQRTSPAWTPDKFWYSPKSVWAGNTAHDLAKSA